VAEIGAERTGEFKKNILEILAGNPDGLQANDLFVELEKRMPSTDFENAAYERNGKRRRPFIVSFVSIGLAKAGWLTKDRGFWRITNEGKQALLDFPNPLNLRAEERRLYRVWKSTRPGAELEELEEIDEEDDSIALAVSIEDAESTAFDLVAQYLGSMHPYIFQDLINALLQGMGYHVSWVAPPGKDGGIDLVAFGDHFGAQGPRIKVQVKRQASSAGVDSIRSFLGVLSERDDIGLYICLGGFTPDAEKEARTHASKRLTLIDAKKLYELWIEHYEKLPQTSRSLFPLRPVYYLDLEK
jgi:restriction system protein